MKSKFKRIIASFMAVIMVLSALSAVNLTVFAAEVTSAVEAQVEEAPVAEEYATEETKSTVVTEPAEETTQPATSATQPSTQATQPTVTEATETVKPAPTVGKVKNIVKTSF